MSEALTVADYEEVLADYRALVRRLDVALNGDGAARQASLCDLVSQFEGRKTTTEGLPRDVPCPHCGADIDWGCTTVSHTGRWRSATHAKRWKAVGIAKPDADDLHRDYRDGKDRDQRLNDRASSQYRKFDFAGHLEQWMRERGFYATAGACFIDLLAELSAQIKSDK